MNNNDFSTTILVKATPAEVFDAINNVRGWWSENIEGATDRLNSEFRYHYQDIHRTTMKITVLIPGRKVVWHVLDNHFNFIKDGTEWIGTDVIFELSENEDGTTLKFTHRGLVPAYECFQVCQDAWTHYIEDSLKNLIENGKGSPTPKQEHDQQEEATFSGDAEAQAGSKSICHRLLIGVAAEKVYAALTTQEGLAGWWTPETTAQAEVGSTLRFAFGPDYYKEMKVAVLKPYSKVRWLCVRAYEEWIGTTLTFTLEPHAKGTILFFRHDGWKDYTAEFAACSYHWALFFRSLKFLCETGKGFPYPDVNT